MPVYIRKNVSYTPPSVDKPPPEDEDDFINDPELIRDDLPQPFRMIDKVLSNLIDDSWDLISEREEARKAEAQKIRPPEYEYSMCLEGPIPGTPYPEKQTLSYATCMTDSVDGKYIFIGLPCGLVALDALAQNFLGSWEEEGAEVTYIQSYNPGNSVRGHLMLPVHKTLSYATCMTDSVDGKYIFIGLPCGLVALDALAQNFLGSWEEEGAEVTYIQSYNPGNSVRGHLMLPVHKTLSYATCMTDSVDGKYIFIGLPCGLVALDALAQNFLGSWEEEGAETLSYATCMTDSVDGKYIFIGLPCGLVALDALAQNFLGSWEEEGAEVTYIQSYQIGPELYLINTIDDMGIGRLFAFTNNKMFLLKTLNTNPPDSESKTLVSKLESSKDGDYLGVVMENVAAKEMWLEVHKLPKENWANELDSIIQALKKKEEKREEQAISEGDTESVVASELDSQQQQQDPLPAQAAPIDTSDPSQQTGRMPRQTSQRKVSFAMFEQRQSLSKMQEEINRDTPDTDPQIVNVEYSKVHDPLAGEYKFSAPQLVMKVKSPPQITGVNVSNLATTCQKIDGGDVVGSGQNHLFSQTHLDLRQNVFDHLHDNLLKYLPQEEDDLLAQQPYFHFLTPGRMLPMGMEQSALEGRPTIIAVWWPGSTNLTQYSLIKTSKDIEFKPDLVWPFTCKITATAISDDTNVIAVGLENGNIVVWDRYMGSQRGVVTISHSPVVHLKFLNPNLYPQEASGYPPYPTKTGSYLMVLCANSSLYSVNVGPGTVPYPNCITPAVENDDDTVTLIEPLPFNQDLSLTVVRSGKVQLRDTLQGNILCQIQLPDLFEMATPWDPVIALGVQGQLLFVKGTRKIEEDSMDIESTAGSVQSGTVFMYQLTAFPPLDSYWKIKRSSVPFTIHTKYEERVNALLADRTARQAERKARMQDRWNFLKEEINSIHKTKETARRNAERRKLFTAGSVGQIVL